MAADTADYAGIAIIKTRDKLPLLFERDDFFIGKVLKRPAEKVGSQAMRIPLKTQPGGNFGAYSSDGGDLGLGSGTLTNFATVTPLDVKTSIQITMQADWTTDGKEKAIESAIKMNLADAMPQFRTDLDYQMQTAGNGVLATIATGGVSGTTWTLEDLPFGARLLREQQVISVYDTTLATRIGAATIIQVNKELGGVQSIVVDVDPGAVQGYNIVVGGLTGASPVWLNGIPVFHNTSASGTVLGLSRALNYMQANGVDLNGSGVSIPAGRLALNQIKQALGDKASQSLFWHTHPAQLAAIENLKLQISQIIKTGGADTDVDLAFKQDSSFVGVPVNDNIHADPSRLDAINLETWGRCEYKAMDYFEIDGKRIFPIYGSSGAPSAAMWFALVVSMQTFVDNMRACTSLTDCDVPTGYTS